MDESAMRGSLKEMLTAFAAHITFEGAVEGFPAERAGERVPGIDHSAWQLVEHLRRVMEDLIDWVEAETYEARPYPSGYWPANPAPPTADAWAASVEAFRSALRTMVSWTEDESHEILAPLDRNRDHSAFREILLAIAHNGYHIGQLVDLRALLGVPAKDY